MSMFTVRFPCFYVVDFIARHVQFPLASALLGGDWRFAGLVMPISNIFSLSGVNLFWEPGRVCVTSFSFLLACLAYTLAL